MSDTSDFLDKVEKDIELSDIGDENYFKEQDKKFQELHEQLLKLKDENKRQMDIIINSLDELMANKCIIEKTLEHADLSDIQIIDEDLQKSSVVDILSKFTESNDDSKIINASDSNACDTNTSEHADNQTDSINKSIKNDLKESDASEKAEISCDSTKLLKNLHIESEDDEKLDNSNE